MTIDFSKIYTCLKLIAVIRNKNVILDRDNPMMLSIFTSFLSPNFEFNNEFQDNKPDNL